MAIPSRQIGWGTEENLLWQISKQLESLTGVTYNSKKTLLNVTSGENAGAKIETFSGAFSGVSGDTIFTIDLDQVFGGIIEYAAYAPYDSGWPITATYWFSGQIDGGKYITNSQNSYSNSSNEALGNPISYNQDNNLISFYTNIGNGDPVQLVYTVKLFTVPLYNA